MLGEWSSRYTAGQEMYECMETPVAFLMYTNGDGSDGDRV